ncbi:MAG: hypothetical protein KGL04_09510 [Elusimicrobia bacterium]|nr:hypothetical protein [Elusimicrobiota bacterium]
MNIGPYSVTSRMFQSLALNAADAARLSLFGWPKQDGAPADLARAALRANAREELWAGRGHFHFMWTADFGKSLRGAWIALPEDYLSGLIGFMTDESARLGHVPSCFRGGRGFDMPWPRADGLPWLVFAHAWRREKTGQGPDESRRRALQSLLDSYEEKNFEDGLISPRVTGDWVDTVRRPSSTYNNLCAIMMLRLAPDLGLRPRHDAGKMEAGIFERRWRGDYFADAHQSEAPSADGAVAALYLGLGPAAARERLADWLENSGLLDPIPMRCAIGRESAHVPLLTRLTGGYHLSRWPHLGLMALNGLKRQGRDVSVRRAAIENLFRRHGQIVEAVDDAGEPYKSLLLSCERGLSMAAGQYLELAAVELPTQKLA